MVYFEFFCFILLNALQSWGLTEVDFFLICKKGCWFKKCFYLTAYCKLEKEKLISWGATKNKNKKKLLVDLELAELPDWSDQRKSLVWCCEPEACCCGWCHPQAVGGQWLPVMHLEREGEREGEWEMESAWERGEWESKREHTVVAHGRASSALCQS